MPPSPRALPLAGLLLVSPIALGQGLDWFEDSGDCFYDPGGCQKNPAQEGETPPPQVQEAPPPESSNSNDGRDNQRDRSGAAAHNKDPFSHPDLGPASHLNAEQKEAVRQIMNHMPEYEHEDSTIFRMLEDIAENGDLDPSKSYGMPISLEMLHEGQEGKVDRETVDSGIEASGLEAADPANILARQNPLDSLAPEDNLVVVVWISQFSMESIADLAELNKTMTALREDGTPIQNRLILTGDVFKRLTSLSQDQANRLLQRSDHSPDEIPALMEQWDVHVDPNRRLSDYYEIPAGNHVEAAHSPRKQRVQLSEARPLVRGMADSMLP